MSGHFVYFSWKKEAPVSGSLPRVGYAAAHKNGSDCIYYRPILILNTIVGSGLERPDCQRIIPGSEKSEPTLLATGQKQHQQYGDECNSQFHF